MSTYIRVSPPKFMHDTTYPISRTVRGACLKTWGRLARKYDWVWNTCPSYIEYKHRRSLIKFQWTKRPSNYGAKFELSALTHSGFRSQSYSALKLGWLRQKQRETTTRTTNWIWHEVTLNLFSKQHETTSQLQNDLQVAVHTDLFGGFNHLEKY